MWGSRLNVTTPALIIFLQQQVPECFFPFVQSTSIDQPWTGNWAVLWRQLIFAGCIEIVLDSKWHAEILKQVTWTQLSVIRAIWLSDFESSVLLFKTFRCQTSYYRAAWSEIWCWCKCSCSLRQDWNSAMTIWSDELVAVCSRRCRWSHAVATPLSHACVSGGLVTGSDGLNVF